jgi:hypothetical protein
MLYGDIADPDVSPDSRTLMYSSGGSGPHRECP